MRPKSIVLGQMAVDMSEKNMGNLFLIRQLLAQSSMEVVDSWSGGAWGGMELENL